MKKLEHVSFLFLLFFSSSLTLTVNRSKMYSKQILLTLVIALTIIAVTVAQLPLQIERVRGSNSNSARKSSPLRSQDPLLKKSNVQNVINEPGYRLPTNLVPKHYKLEVATVLNNAPAGHFNWTAPGAVRITVTCVENTNRITLNADKLEIHDVTVHDDSDSAAIPIPVDIPVYDKALQFFHINLTSGELVRGKDYVITLKYISLISEDVTGLYRAEYVNDKGIQKWLAVTQFASVGFRLMAPGFDEPNLKSVFTISICRSPEYNSLSNTYIDRNATGSDLILKSCPVGWEWDHYTPTVRMSSYLVALVVSDYTCTEADENIFGKPVGICGPPHLIDSPRNGGDFAVTQAARLLKVFQDTFGPGLEYPMPKMQNVAIPRKYFRWGAMENWGLITYADYRLLYYTGESQESNRYSTSKLVSHELAHQWFGDLVTCEWWSQVWLNEGFATYMSYFGESKIMNEYEPREAFLYDAVQFAMEYDAGPLSHPVINSALQQEVEDMTIFDAISYQKGASLIRMMEGFLGEETLFNGLRLYLTNNLVVEKGFDWLITLTDKSRIKKYTGAAQDDLFEYLGREATEKLPDGVTLKEIMDTWTLQKGFPLIRVSIQSESSDTVYISQERFRTNSAHGSKDLDPDDLWEVPIAVVTEDKPDFKNHSAAIWLQKEVAVVPLTHNTSKWIIVNPEGYGFYRVLYDTDLTTLIQKQLDEDHTVISPLSKSQLIDDYFRCYEQGYIQIETALGMTKFLAGESSHVVWSPVLIAFSKFQQLLSSYLDPFTALKIYFSPKVGGALDAINWTQEDSEHGAHVILRATLLEWACALEHPKCSSIARDYFDSWINKNVTIPLDIQPAIYCAGVASDNRDYFQHVLSMFRSQKGDTEGSVNQISRLLTALTCTKNLEDFVWLVENSVKPEMVEHASLILQNLVKSSYGREKTLTLLLDNWQDFINATGSHQIIADVVSTASIYQSSEAHLAWIEKLIDDVLLKDMDIFFKLQSTFATVVKTVQTNQAWISSNLFNLQTWFEINRS